jgi:deferrochelatase/peroxidase EfeB
MSGRCPFSGARPGVPPGASSGAPAAASSGASRRGFLGGMLAAMPATAFAASPEAKGITPESRGPARAVVEPFYAPHQGGILTPLQNHTVFAAFDVVTEKRDALVDMLKRWTIAAARMSTGQTAAPLPADQSIPAPDSLDALGLAPARLTLTFGLGPTLFAREGKDRFGLAKQRPEALVDMPLFNGDQMIEAKTGGDLSVQACADDPQVAFHAVRQLAAMAYDVAQLRWIQTGFAANFAAEDTPRNLMGFKDGTQNPLAARPQAIQNGAVASLPEDHDGILWVRDEGPAWMHGGSYVVSRRIRISLEHWDRTDIEFQEQVVGRRKLSGAPLTGKSEFDPLDLDATDGDGNPVIPENAHVRLATAATNDGAQILRRAYSYNDGLSFTAERWPPWRQGMLYDAGLFFICYQRDPRTGFIKIFDNMSKLDAMNQFTTHTGGGLFACPPGASEGSYIGQALFEA